MSEPSRWKSGFWIGIGTISLAIGIMGIIIPLLPTTPFLLFAAFCYSRGSRKLHTLILRHKYLGAYIRAYEKGEGISYSVKATSLLLLWGAMSITIVFFIDEVIIMILIVLIGLAISAHILLLRAN
ncbi:MAG: YbaN family protein [Methanomassiliicoccales archaeon]